MCIKDRKCPLNQYGASASIKSIGKWEKLMIKKFINMTDGQKTKVIVSFGLLMFVLSYLGGTVFGNFYFSD
jgi:hypothetical protein